MVLIPQAFEEGGEMIAQIEQAQRIGDPLLGIIIPAIILGLSVFFTWLLYKRFSK